MNRRLARWLGGGSAATLAVLFLLPLGMVLRGGLFFDGRPTLAHVAAVFRNPIYAEGLATSLVIATGTTVLATALATPLAWLSVRRDFSGRRALSSLVLLPMVLPPFVGAIGVQHILGRCGALNAMLGGASIDWLSGHRTAAVILLQSLALFPVVFLNASAALANIDPALEEVAENLGCRGWRKFRRITLPLMFPGLFAGGAIVFIWSFTELGTPLMLGLTRCAPVQIYDALKEIGTESQPYALVMVMLGACLAIYAAARALAARHLRTMPPKGVAAASAARWTGWRGALAATPFVAVAAAALLPHLGVVLVALARPGAWYRTALPTAWTLSHFADAMGHDLTLTSLRNSLVYASGAVALDLILGVAIAAVVVRSDLRARGALDALATLPLAVPGLVMAFGYLALSARLSHATWVRESDAAQWLFDVRSHPAVFLIVAYGIRRLPYMVRAAAAGLQQAPATFEEAASVAGATPWRTLRRITAPLISANLIAGGLLTFAFSLLEVSDSLLLAQRMDYYPITKTIYELFSLVGPGPYLAAALGVWAMMFLGTTIAAASLLLGRRFGAFFRV